MTQPFGPGELALLVDSRGRQYLLNLAAGAEFHSHTGVVDHDDILGGVEGVTVRSGTGARYTAMRPSLTDFVLRMPRGAQVVYPKDIAAILQFADVRPGSRVFEAGVGSGALSIGLLRAGADVVGYDVRSEFAERALANVATFLGAAALERYRLEHRDAYEGIAARDLDSVVLDLPEPWRVVGHAEGALRRGGMFVAYTPSVTQVMQLRETLAASNFELVGTVEVLQRSWHVEGQAVRPDHRMVAHTAFLTHGRLLGPVPGGLVLPRTPG